MNSIGFWKQTQDAFRSLVVTVRPPAVLNNLNDGALAALFSDFDPGGEEFF
jgi:hypothetical protein